MLLVGRAAYSAFVWPGGTEYALIIEAGYDVLHFSVTKVASQLGVECLEPRSENYGAYFHFNCFRLLMKVYSSGLADSCANTARTVFQVEACFRIYIRDQRKRLGKVDMNGFIR